MNEQLLNRIRQCPSLPPVPSIALQVIDLMERPEIDVEEIARVIARDPELSRRILRAVNCSFYARSQSVSSLSHALVILGLQGVRTLILGFSLISSLHRHRPRSFNHACYWRRAVLAGTAARQLAVRADILQQEEVLLAALLMDLGMLVFDQVLGEHYREIQVHAAAHDALAPAESSRLGMNHAEVAALLARQWKLPPLLSVPMGSHAAPEAVDDPDLQQIARLLHLSGRCADVFLDDAPAGAIDAVRLLCAEHFNLPPADADALLEATARGAGEVAARFEINLDPRDEFNSLLRRARAASASTSQSAEPEPAAAAAADCSR
jgi:HD-like signal output (HDOD) protein